MSQDIEAYRNPGAPQLFQAEAVESDQDANPPTISVVGILRRRWPLMLVVAVLVASVGLPYVLMTSTVSYRSTAQVEVAPILPRILYHDEDSGVMPFFDRFLYTQKERILGQGVLHTALKDPRLADLEIQAAPNPVALLRLAIQVEILPGTHLLEVSATHAQRDTANRIAAAVIDAYMNTAVQAESAEIGQKRNVLLDHQARLEATLDEQRQTLRELANRYGTASASTLEARRQQVDEAMFAARDELQSLELKILELRDEVEKLQGWVDNGPPASRLADDRERAIAENPVISTLQAQLDRESINLVEMRALMGDEHPSVVATRDEIARLEKELEKHRQRVATEVDARLEERWTANVREQLAQVHQQLQMAERRRSTLEEAVHRQENEAMDIGKLSLQIQALQEKIELTQFDWNRVDERLEEINVESRRPARVTIASTPEVRPNGVLDGRRKKSLMVLLGACFLAGFVGFVRDLMDPSLHVPRDVETQVGLPVLGAVPCLAELRSGRITQEDFIESYRVVRAALCSLGTDGRPPHSLLVTSAQSGEGKTSLAISLAASLAELGGKVLLLDGDVQAPQIGQLLKVSRLDGLKRALKDHWPLSELAVPSPLPGVDVLAADSNGGAVRGGLSDRAAQRLLREAQTLYDHIVVDSPPALGSADTLIWARCVDGVILSSLTGQTDTAAMKLACQRLRAIRARMLGAVVGNVSVRQSYYSVSTSRSTYEKRRWGFPGTGYADQGLPTLAYIPEDRPPAESPATRDDAATQDPGQLGPGGKSVESDDADGPEDPGRSPRTPKRRNRKSGRSRR